MAMTLDRRAALERGVLSHMRTPVMVFDPARRLVDMNPAAEELLEVSLKQSGGLGLSALLDDWQDCDNALARVMASGQPLTEREMTLKLPGTGPIKVDCTITPIAGDGNGAVMELITLERYMQISREERLVRESESARAVLRGLAHEIRHPLGGLRGAAQLLERELTDDALREYTQIIVGEVDRLQSLMDRMLGPRTPPRMRRVSIHEVTERVYALLRAEAPEGVVVDKDYDPSIPDLNADSEMLIQAVLNVARNAVQAVEERGRVLLRTRIHRQFTIGQRRHRLVARIDVLDNGPGIEESIRHRIFYPLVTGRSVGTGLGLSIAQSLINQHGGLIECSSRPGHTEFSILLPLCPDLDGEHNLETSR